MEYKPEAKEVIAEIYKMFDQDAKDFFEYERGGRRFTIEEILLVKFGRLELSCSKEEALRIGRDLAENSITIYNGEKYYPSHWEKYLEQFGKIFKCVNEDGMLSENIIPDLLSRPTPY